MDKKTVSINGRKYDAKSGMPIKGSTALTNKRTVKSASVHSRAQKSKTLMRRAAKKPADHVRKSVSGVMDIARSSKISKFAPRTSQPTPKTTAKKEVKDIPATRHPIVEKAISNINAVAKPIQKTAKDMKNEAIAMAMAKTSSSDKPIKLKKRNSKLWIIISISLVVLVVGAYLTYTNMPSFSVRIAAVQAGISATYPEYRPDGYSIDGPINFSEGEVVINFKANTGSTKFTLKQTKSSWDSTAVLDNIVRKKVGEQYLTSQEQGLTIYTYNGNAAWVNGGILYIIEGDALLGSSQIRRMAISL